LGFRGNEEEDARESRSPNVLLKKNMEEGRVREENSEKTCTKKGLIQYASTPGTSPVEAVEKVSREAKPPNGGRMIGATNTNAVAGEKRDSDNYGRGRSK